MMKTKEKSRVYELIEIKISYLCIETGLREYLAENPLNVIDIHDNDKIDLPYDSDEFAFYKNAVLDFYKISGLIHKARSLIFEAIAYHLKIYQLAQVINNKILGDKTKSTQDFINWHTEYLKKNSNPTFFKYPSEDFNLMKRFVNFLVDKLTDYQTIKKIVFLYLEKYKLKDIFNQSKMFENWEEAYNNDLWNDVILFDDSEFCLCIPRLEEVPSPNLKEYRLILESLDTDLKTFEEEINKKNE